MKNDDPLIIDGKLEKGEKGAKILVRGIGENASEWQKQQRGPAGDIRSLLEVRSQTTKRVVFSLTMDETTLPQQMDSLREIIQRHQGAVPASIQFVIPNRSRSSLPLADSMAVVASDDLKLEVERLFGYNTVFFE